MEIKMGLFDFLFRKKKTASLAAEPESDGQEKYLIDEEPALEVPEQITAKSEPGPVIIPGDKVKIEGTRGRTLKESVKAADGTVTPKNNSTNTVIKKVGGIVVTEDSADTAPMKATVNSSGESRKEKPAKEATKAAARTAAKAVEKPAKAAAIAATKPVAEPVAEADDGVVIESKTTRSGKFELKRAKDGRFFFNLYASNHTVIAFSQIYSSSQSAMTGIKSVMANAGVASLEDTTLKNPVPMPFPKWEIYIDRAKQYRFRLYAGNGNCVCHAAHGYATKSGCKGGIDSIIRFAAEARIDKKYLTK